MGFPSDFRVRKLVFYDSLQVGWKPEVIVERNKKIENIYDILVDTQNADLRGQIDFLTRELRLRTIGARPWDYLGLWEISTNDDRNATALFARFAEEKFPEGEESTIIFGLRDTVAYEAYRLVGLDSAFDRWIMAQEITTRGILRSAEERYMKTEEKKQPTSQP